MSSGPFPAAPAPVGNPLEPAVATAELRVCDAVTYKSIPDTDYDAEIRCTEPATVEIPLSDGRLHPRCKAHIPMMLRGLAMPL